MPQIVAHGLVVRRAQRPAGLAHRICAHWFIALAADGRHHAGMNTNRPTASLARFGRSSTKCRKVRASRAARLASEYRLQLARMRWGVPLPWINGVDVSYVSAAEWDHALARWP